MKQQYTAAPTTGRDWLNLVLILGAIALTAGAGLMLAWTAIRHLFER